MVLGIDSCSRMKSRKERYGSLVFVGVFSSGVKGGEPPTLHSQRLGGPKTRRETVYLPVVDVGGGIRQTDSVLHI